MNPGIEWFPYKDLAWAELLVSLHTETRHVNNRE